jgi:hypothetical protein
MEERYMCAVCPEYDICGECYMKYEMGDEPADTMKSLAHHVLKAHPMWAMNGLTRMAKVAGKADPEGEKVPGEEKPEGEIVGDAKPEDE